MAIYTTCQHQPRIYITKVLINNIWNVKKLLTMTPPRYISCKMHSRPFRLVTYPRIPSHPKCRTVSNEALVSGSPLKQPPAFQNVNKKALPCLSVMPTRILLRSLFVSSVLSSPRLVRISLPILKIIANSNSWLLNSDRNPLLHSIVRKLIYDQFCAGENDVEVRNTIAMTKAMGYEGVILGYAKETVVSKKASSTEVVSPDQDRPKDEVIREWKDGNLRTLKMLGSGDFLAVK